MITFNDLLTSIKISEGFSSKVYLCPSGVKTLGYGFTSSCFPAGKMPDTISKIDADDLLERIVKKLLEDVESQLKKWGYTDSEVLALKIPLTDFTYNCGMANLKNLTKSGTRSISEILDKITEYNKGAGKVLAGLVKRREMEKSWIIENLKGTPSIKPSEHTAKELQTLVNNLYGYDVLKVDGSIGKESIRYIYDLLLKMI